MFGTNGPFCAWKWRVVITLDLHQGIFFNFSQWGTRYKGPRGTVDQTYVNNFFEEILVWSEWAILGQKTMHYLNSELAQRFFKNILFNESSQKVNQNDFNGVFPKKFTFRVNRPFWTQKWCAVSILNVNITQWRGAKVYENYKNFIVVQMIHSGPKMLHPYNSDYSVRVQNYFFIMFFSDG